MPLDLVSPFGTHQLKSTLQKLINLSQSAPRNLIGHQFAKWARRKVLKTASMPADISVGELKLRCYMLDNYTERKYVFMPWRFDKKEREAMFAALPRDGVFIDIGANVGVYTLEAATRMGAEGKVLAIEPYQPLYQRLLFNIAATASGRSSWPQVVVLPVGVADEEKTFELHLNQGNLGQNSIRPQDSEDSREAATELAYIHCRPLLAILKEASVQHIDVLKIDIEGAEDMALCPFLDEASAELLPKLIVIEDSAAQWQLDLKGLLKRRGYEVQLRTRMNIVYRLQSNPVRPERTTYAH